MKSTSKDCSRRKKGWLPRSATQNCPRPSVPHLEATGNDPVIPLISGDLDRKKQNKTINVKNADDIVSSGVECFGQVERGLQGDNEQSYNVRLSECVREVKEESCNSPGVLFQVLRTLLRDTEVGHVWGNAKQDRCDEK